MQVISLSVYDKEPLSTTLVSVRHMIITFYHVLIEKGNRISFTFWWRLPVINFRGVGEPIIAFALSKT